MPNFKEKKRKEGLRKDRLLNAINTQLANLERKTPKNKSNIDMRVDAEIGGDEEEILKKKMTKKT